MCSCSQHHVCEFEHRGGNSVRGLRRALLQEVAEERRLRLLDHEADRAGGGRRLRAPRLRRRAARQHHAGKRYEITRLLATGCLGHPSRVLSHQKHRGHSVCKARVSS